MAAPPDRKTGLDHPHRPFGFAVAVGLLAVLLAVVIVAFLCAASNPVNVDLPDAAAVGEVASRRSGSKAY